MLRDGKFDDKQVEMDVEQAQAMPVVEVFSNSGMGMDDIGSGIKDAFGKMFPKKKNKRKFSSPSIAWELKILQSKARE